MSALLNKATTSIARAGARQPRCSAVAVRMSARSPLAAPLQLQAAQRVGVRANLFRKAPPADEGSGEYQRREDYTYQDVEDYFNYMGFLAEEGSYDRMEGLLALKPAFIDAILLLAASQNDTPKVKEVLGCGADPKVKDQNGKTALELATKDETRRLIEAALAVKA